MGAETVHCTYGLVIHGWQMCLYIGSYFNIFVNGLFHKLLLCTRLTLPTDVVHRVVLQSVVCYKFKYLKLEMYK